MKNHELFTLVQTMFFEKLEKKTGWGRNEIKQLFVEVVAEASTFLLDQERQNEVKESIDTKKSIEDNNNWDTGSYEGDFERYH